MPDLRDILFVSGTAALWYGGSLIAPAVGYIALGTILLAMALWGFLHK